MRAPVGTEDTILLAAHTQILYYDPTYTPFRPIFDSGTSDSETGIAQVLHAGLSALVAAASSVESQRFSGYCLGPVSELCAVRAEGLPRGSGSSTVLT